MKGRKVALVIIVPSLVSSTKPITGASAAAIQSATVMPNSSGADARQAEEQEEQLDDEGRVAAQLRARVDYSLQPGRNLQPRPRTGHTERHADRRRQRQRAALSSLRVPAVGAGGRLRYTCGFEETALAWSPD